MYFFKYLISKLFWKQILIAFAVIGIGVFVGFKWLSITTNHNQKIQVPYLKGESLTKAVAILKEVGLRYQVIDSLIYDPNLPKHAILSQEPEAALFVKENRKIYLHINASHFRSVSVKPFYSKTKYEVIAQLRSSGFQIGKVEYVDDPGKDVVRKLKFEGEELKAGDFLQKMSVVDLVIGNGKVTYLSKQDSIAKENKALLDSISNLEIIENTAETF